MPELMSIDPGMGDMERPVCCAMLHAELRNKDVFSGEVHTFLDSGRREKTKIRYFNGVKTDFYELKGSVSKPGFCGDFGASRTHLANGAPREHLHRFLCLNILRITTQRELHDAAIKMVGTVLLTYFCSGGS